MPKQRIKAWLDGIVSAVLVAASLVILYNGLRSNSTKDQSQSGAGTPYRAENIEFSQLTIKLLREAYVPGELVAIEFADFECRYCRIFANELLPMLRDQAKFVFRHFPLTNRNALLSGPQHLRYVQRSKANSGKLITSCLPSQG